MKKILGLDIGTNSIGWALIESNVYDENPDNLDGRIIQMGSRIIPMNADAMSKFESGIPESKAAGRRMARGARRLNQRYKLRRSRLIDALKIVGWLNTDFPKDFKGNTKHSINTYLPFSQELIREAAVFFEIEKKMTTKDKNYAISDDWLIYFLKVKALKQQVSLSELARILYHYNQRRGYKSSRGDAKDEVESKEIKFPITEKWVEIVKIESITPAGTEKEYTFYDVRCATPTLTFTATVKRKNPLEWLGKDIELDITKTTTKDTKIKYNISVVDASSWENRKLALEKDIEKRDESISEYYLKNLKTALNEPTDYRIKQRIVDRKFYQKELEDIWKEQAKHYAAEFNDKVKIAEIADTFYIHNKEKNKELKGKDLFHVFFNDIIYYQRGLKSQKGLLDNCQFETKTFKNKDGSTETVGVKVASKSSPAFQEFRIWQTIHNLKIIPKGIADTPKINLSNEDKERIFELFDKSKEVSHKKILELFFKKTDIENYELNYPDKDFLGNETKAIFRKVFKKHNFEAQGEAYLDNAESFYQLFHILYSLDEEGILHALANKKYFDFPVEIINNLSKIKPFDSQYASFSTKALNNLLPLMRVGKYWNKAKLEPLPKEKKGKGFNDFPSVDLRERIETLPTWVEESNIPDKARIELKKQSSFEGLPTYLASYIAYGRHSERTNDEKYDKVEDIDIKKLIPNNSLRNPTVEKIIRETLNLVKEIWANDALSRPDYIHVELGREMKKNTAERKSLTESNEKNRIEKERITALLKELKYENFNEGSPADIDKFRIWKDNGGHDGEANFDLLFKNNRAEFIHDADIEKYRLWAEQNYLSPYSGLPIPLSKLFTRSYEIDHILPQSKFYDDSFGNKVVVEAELNKLKDNQLAMPFIENFEGKLANEKVRVISLEAYKALVDGFTNKKKKRHLSLSEVPEDFVERQMNDTKYISKTVANLLYPVAKAPNGVVYTSGSITSDLKNKWGLNLLWKDILKPRFERLEKILEETLIFPDEKHQSAYHFGKDYKRIDHRHHALDALIIACTSRVHIQYLNTLSGFSNDQTAGKKFEDWATKNYLLKKKDQLKGDKKGMTDFALPWTQFYLEAREALEAIIVSHKKTGKLISTAFNRYQKWVEVDGQWEKQRVIQIKPQATDKYWVAVRQELFAMPLGKTSLPEYKKDVPLEKAIKAQIEFIEQHKYEWNTAHWRIAKTALRKRIDGIVTKHNFDIKAIMKHLTINPLRDEAGKVVEYLDLLQFVDYASKRRAINEQFTEDTIKKMPFADNENNWLTNLLRNHLSEYNNNPKEAFKGEGLEQLFKQVPVNKVSVLDGIAANKIDLGSKLMEGVAGVNQYFVIEITKELDKKTGELKTIRNFSTPKFLDCIKYLALDKTYFDSTENYIVLSPGDMVYVPETGENINNIDWADKKRIASRVYIVKSFGDNTCYFLPNNISSLIQPYDSKTKKGEFGSPNKTQTSIDGINIKESCIKLEVDRLGNIKPI